MNSHNAIKMYKELLPKCHQHHITFLISNNDFVNRNFDDIKINNKSTYSVLGGSTKYELTYNNKQFKFKFSKSNNAVSIVNKDNKEICLMIMFDKERKEANIQNVSMHPACSVPKTISGKEIMMVAMKFLKKYRKEFNVDIITLTDNSMKNIDGCDRLPLSNYYMILHGETWYGSFGFVPYENIKNVVDKNKLKVYLREQKMVKKATVENYYDFFKKWHKKLCDQDIHQKTDCEYVDFLNKNKKMFIGDFIRLLFNKYNKKCKVNKLIEKLHKEMKLTNYKGTTFCFVF